MGSPFPKSLTWKFTPTIKSRFCLSIWLSNFGWWWWGVITWKCLLYFESPYHAINPYDDASVELLTSSPGAKNHQQQQQQLRALPSRDCWEKSIKTKIKFFRAGMMCQLSYIVHPSLKCKLTQILGPSLKNSFKCIKRNPNYSQMIFKIPPRGPILPPLDKFFLPKTGFEPRTSGSQA